MDVFVKTASDFNLFKKSLNRALKVCGDMKPRLFHLHITLGDNAPKEIVLKSGERISVHVLLLPPDVIQHQTVYKTASLETLLATAHEILFAADASFKVIGLKAEALFNRVELCANLSRLFMFNYIELHSTVRPISSKSELKNHSIMLSYSVKHASVVSAQRFFPPLDVAGAASVLSEETGTNVEVSIYDSWDTDNLETAWVNFSSEHTLEESEKYCSTVLASKALE